MGEATPPLEEVPALLEVETLLLEGVTLQLGEASALLREVMLLAGVAPLQVEVPLMREEAPASL